MSKKKEIKIGDIVIKSSKLGLDFYIKNKKTCWLNVKGAETLKEFLVKIYAKR